MQIWVICVKAPVMNRIVIRNVHLVNEGKVLEGTDVLVKDGKFEKIGGVIDVPAKEVDGTGKYMFPGIIDDQVHFREPGLTHKADIGSESRAAVQGGCTLFMEMPNTSPPATDAVRLQEKYNIASEVSPANFSFYLGATNDNLEEVLQVDPRWVCGVKIFMGSSTGNMLVDNPVTLEDIFRESPCLIATHCEDEERVRARMKEAREKYGDDAPPSIHPIIRDHEACYLSSSLAVELANKHNTRLHILHLTTAMELDLFRNDIPRQEKRITAEVCVHHLYFNDTYYASLGNQIKCNPAIKTEKDRLALHAALKDGRLDVIATDHAPHTWEEKSGSYWTAPSGLPLVSHAFNVMMSFYHNGEYSLPFIADRMSHAVADIYQIKDRGYIREGYWADFFLADLDKEWTVSPSNILYKCGWSPFNGHTFKGKVQQTFVNGIEVYNDDGGLTGELAGMRVEFDRS